MATKSPHSRLRSLKHALAATTRALAASPRVTVDFGVDTPRLVAHRILLPLPEAELTSAEVGALRGTADQLALTYRYHSPTLHASLAPDGGPAREFFDWAENARLVALASEHGAGVRANLEKLFASQCRQAGMQGVRQQSDAPLAIAAALRLRRALTGAPLPAAAAHLESFWHEALDAHLEPGLPGLRQLIRNQGAFGQYCLHLIHALQLEAHPEDEAATLTISSGADESPEEGLPEPGGFPDDLGEALDPSAARLAADGAANRRGARQNTPGEEQRAGADDARWAENGLLVGQQSYRAYTCAHDQIVRAEALSSADELRRLRGQLDRQTRPLQQLLARLSNRLEQALMAHRPHLWETGLDQGLLDNARLASLIVDPRGHSAYRLQRTSATKDTAVTLLIDSSGSMRGKPIATAAVCADLVGQALERCGIRIEILGFTTADWRGGQCRQQWIRAGGPETPGRLNDLLHIIYKSAGEPWRRTSRNLGLMLQDGLLKENVDGEALLWAHRRLIQRPEHRRILVVLSDGLPADHSTDQENPPGYLEAHLRETIARIEQQSPVELAAIGIGHDVSAFYRRSTTIKHAGELAFALTTQLTNLLLER
jgi:cobaltochelatase CobT